ncbi:linear amide C-N hydrolase [Paracoccus sp. PAR01]|uniref:linear amide C-N hydrolase n=1 Tax=Paracoccus sp. PAR01 TaxID=2769282 RepID=UPI001CE17AE0
MHLPISGKAGDSTIIENIDGKRVIHHSQEYQVMTNPPIFEEQSALETYCHRSREGHAAQHDRASNRFAWASFRPMRSRRPKPRLRVLPASSGVIRSASVPYSIYTPDQPNSAPPKRDIAEDGY